MCLFRCDNVLGSDAGKNLLIVLNNLIILRNIIGTLYDSCNYIKFTNYVLYQVLNWLE